MYITNPRPVDGVCNSNIGWTLMGINSYVAYVSIL